MNAASRFRLRPSWHAGCVIVLLASGSACGLKGPLYAPDEKPDMIEVRTPGTPASSAEKKPRNTGAAPSGQSAGGTPRAEDLPKEE